MRLRADVIVGGLLLASCTTGPERNWVDRSSPPSSRQPVVDEVVKLGKPYRIGGRLYTPVDDRNLEQIGMASWYGHELRGRPTANGETFDPDAISAAHPTLPMPSYVEVTALDSGRTVLVRVNDRGPFHSDRIIDLSLGAARALGLTGGGARAVRVRRVEASVNDKLALRSGNRAKPREQLNLLELDSARQRSNWTPPSASSAEWTGPAFIQIAAFGSEERARTLATSLGARVVEERGIYRVRLGPFANIAKARAALEPLGAKGYPDATITR